MNMQFFSKYIDDYKKNNKDTIGKIVKVGKSSRGIDYSEALLKWNAIKNFFGLNESAQKLFDQAATGLELGRITQLNSSSLFAFLFFHSVSKGNGVKIDGFGDELFTNVAFEVSNKIDEATLPKIYEGRKPVSHIDVVLYNEMKVILLECKFSEYLEHYSCSPAKVASSVYGDFYNMLFGKEGNEIDELKKCVDDKNNAFIIVKGSESDQPCYYDGLKQTIAHFMGAHGILNSGRRHKDLQLEDKELHLAEVVFDFSNFDSLSAEEREAANTALKTYAKFHKKLCDKLNSLRNRVPGGRDVIVHSKLLSYQNDFKLKLPPVFADLYQLSNRPGIKTN
ncbi:MAG: hypothetical protein IKJ37_08740 [Kiritimatiellae bacterium]|nr:hypothetical protein [Kiritimatiellia bacterium]